MQPDESPGWRLVDFVERLELWDKLESPDQDRRLLVAQWIMARHDNPYQGMLREPGFDNLWSGRIRETWRPDGTMVTCSYFIHETIKIIKCNHIGSLNLPI